MTKSFLVVLLLASVIAALYLAGNDYSTDKKRYAFDPAQLEVEEPVWTGPDLSTIPDDENGKMIQYGHELIANTAQYLGPHGSVAQVTNGLNCQNCHLDGGSKPWGNNYFAFAPNFPKFRPRSGKMTSMAGRVNGCFERSMNGQKLDTSSKEMTAILAYMNWLATDIPKGKKVKGTGIPMLPFLDRAADPDKGKLVYTAKCQACHGADGQGSLKPDAKAYQFPPLWGEHSYNNGAGLYRLSRFAGYVKNNMPLGASHDHPQLTDEEAWDVAAFVNSQPRPKKDLSKDWPDISKKPIDHPFGPFADQFSEQQHKYGPFGPIQKAMDKAKSNPNK